MSFLVTTTPIDTKTNRSPGHGRHAAVCQISLSYNAAFRRSLETEKINKHSDADSQTAQFAQMYKFFSKIFKWCFFVSEIPLIHSTLFSIRQQSTDITATVIILYKFNGRNIATIKYLSFTFTDY